MSRKGISPIIAAVLLVAVSLSVVAIFSGWAPDLVKTITKDTTNSTLETLECDRAAVNIESAYYNTTGDETTVTVRNTDRASLPDLVVAAFDSNDVIIEQKTGINLSAGEINDTTVNTPSEPSYVKAFSRECAKVEHRLDDISQ